MKRYTPIHAAPAPTIIGPDHRLVTRAATPAPSHVSLRGGPGGVHRLIAETGRRPVPRPPKG